MIDPHVHLRDWNQKNKDTLERSLSVLFKAGCCAAFEMPNTDPPLTSLENLRKRKKDVAEVITKLGLGRFFHGMYGGITADPVQIAEMVNAYKELYPYVVGLKMFAGNSTGNMGIIKEEEQRLVYKTLAKEDVDYRGVLAVHCEKEAYVNSRLFVPSNPFTHTLARPPEAEVESVKDQIKFANEAHYKGTLHICHISVPIALEEIESARKYADFRITCGLTPHHARLYDEMMKPEYWQSLGIELPFKPEEMALFLKMNPALRPRTMQEQMLDALLAGRIDWIESDHANHSVGDKLKPPYASGISVAPYLPHFIKFLKSRGMPDKMVEDLTHNNIANAFNILMLENWPRDVDYNLAKEYAFDAFLGVKYG